MSNKQNGCISYINLKDEVEYACGMRTLEQERVCLHYEREKHWCRYKGVCEGQFMPPVALDSCTSPAAIAELREAHEREMHEHTTL